MDSENILIGSVGSCRVCDGNIRAMGSAQYPEQKQMGDNRSLPDWHWTVYCETCNLSYEPSGERFSKLICEAEEKKSQEMREKSQEKWSRGWEDWSPTITSADSPEGRKAAEQLGVTPSQPVHYKEGEEGRKAAKEAHDSWQEHLKKARDKTEEAHRALKRAEVAPRAKREAAAAGLHQVSEESETVAKDVREGQRYDPGVDWVTDVARPHGEDISGKMKELWEEIEPPEPRPNSPQETEWEQDW